MKQTVTVYSPIAINSTNIWQALGQLVSNFITYRSLIWRLAFRDIKAKYRQSILGPTWVVIMPLAMMSTFLLLNMSGIITFKNIPVPYPIWGFLGISLWTLFAQGLTLTTDSLSLASAMIGKTNIPKEIFVFSAFSQTLADLLVRLALVTLIHLLYWRLPSPWILVFPLYLLPLVLLTIGLGFFTATLNAIFKDTIHIVSIALSFLIFLTPIMYSFPEQGILSQVNNFNPLYFLIEVPRSLIIAGQIEEPLKFIGAVAVALFIFLAGWWVFHRAAPKLTERI